MFLYVNLTQKQKIHFMFFKLTYKIHFMFCNNKQC